MINDKVRPHKWEGGKKIGEMPPDGMERLILDSNPRVEPIGQLQDIGGGSKPVLVTRYYVIAGNVLLGRNGKPLSFDTHQEASTHLEGLVEKYTVIRTAREEGLEMFWDVAIEGVMFLTNTTGGVPVLYQDTSVKAPDPETAVLATIGKQWTPVRIDSIINKKGDDWVLIVPVDGNKLGVLNTYGKGVKHMATPVDIERLYWLNGVNAPNV